MGQHLIDLFPQSWLEFYVRAFTVS